MHFRKQYICRISTFICKANFGLLFKKIVKLDLLLSMIPSLLCRLVVVFNFLIKQLYYLLNNDLVQHTIFFTCAYFENFYDILQRLQVEKQQYFLLYREIK